jgi:hypothetical protein
MLYSFVEICHCICSDVSHNAKPAYTSPFHFFKNGSDDLVTVQPIYALWKEGHYDSLGWCCVGLEFFTALRSRILVFRDVKRHCCVSGYQHYRETFEPLKMKVKHSFKKMGANYLVMQHHIPEDWNKSLVLP